MTCKDIDRILPGYMDEALSPAERARVEEHLAACARCRTALADLQRVVDWEKDLDEVDAPPWLAPKIMARVMAETDRRRGIIGRLFFPLHIKLPLEALAMICVAMLVVAVYRAGGPEVQRLALHPVPQVAIAPETDRAEISGQAVQPMAPAIPPRVSIPYTSDQERQAVSASRIGKAPTGSLPVRSKAPEHLPTLAPPAPASPVNETRSKAALDEEKAYEAAPPILAEKKDKQERPAQSDTSKALRRSLAAQSAASMTAESSQTPPEMLKISVVDVDVAGKAVEEMLQAFRAPLIERQAEKGKIVLIWRLPSGDIPALLAKLKELGDLEGGLNMSREIRTAVPVRLEIIPRTKDKERNIRE